MHRKLVSTKSNCEQQVVKTKSIDFKFNFKKQNTGKACSIVVKLNIPQSQPNCRTMKRQIYSPGKITNCNITSKRPLNWLHILNI